MAQPWTSLKTLEVGASLLASSSEISAASCLILLPIQLSSFYLLPYDASTKSPGAGKRAPIMHLIGSFSTPANSPKARSSSPSPLSLILRRLSLHFSQKLSPLFIPPCPPRSPSRGACCVCGCQDGTGPTAALSLVYRLGSRLRTPNIPPRPLVNSACALPHLPLFKCKVLPVKIYLNPSQSIEVK